jgi:hypothetical protein
MLKNNINDKKADPFEFNKKEKTAFELLKIFFIRAPILIHFKSDRQIRIKTDILNFTIIEILSQSENGANYKQLLNILISNNILFPQNDFSEI